MEAYPYHLLSTMVRLGMHAVTIISIQLGGTYYLSRCLTVHVKSFVK